jgi:Mg2+ and Co2+ transporter CorA
MTWPVTFLTGYWGMNFQNMTELTAVDPSEGPGPIPNLYGIQIYWMVGTFFLFLTLYIVFRARFYQTLT